MAHRHAWKRLIDGSLLCRKPECHVKIIPAMGAAEAYCEGLRAPKRPPGISRADFDAAVKRVEESWGITPAIEAAAEVSDSLAKERGARDEAEPSEGGGAP